MTRILDIVFSLIFLILLSPLILLIAILIKIDSPGPVFFVQERMGKDFRKFRMLKFRKMRSDLRSQGPAITSRYDSRFTAVGRWLERTKLDELPQLINVLLGDMSIVGPRPEAEKFTTVYTKKWEKVLSVKPGLIGVNQILNRNESELYPADCLDREDYYVKHILPRKLREDIQYIRKASFLYNLRLLALAAFYTVFGAVTRQSVISTARSVYLLAAYTAVSLASICIAYRLRFEGEISPSDFRAYRFSLPLTLVVSPIAFAVFRTHRRMFGSMTLEDLAALFKSCVICSFLIVVALVLSNFRGISRIVYCIDFFLRFLALAFLVYLEHQITQKRKLLAAPPVRRTMLFECFAIGFISLFAVVVTSNLLLLREGIAEEVIQAQWVMLSLLILVPAIYLITLQPMPCRLLYYMKIRCKQVAMIVAQSFLFLILISLLLDIRTYSRVAVFAGLGVLTISLLLFFLVMWHYRWRRMPETGGKRVLLVGLTGDIDLFISALNRSRQNYAIVGIISNEIRDRFYTVSKIEVLGALNDLNDVLDVYHVDTFVVSRESISPQDREWVRKVADKHGIQVRHLVGVDGFMTAKESAGLSWF